MTVFYTIVVFFVFNRLESYWSTHHFVHRALQKPTTGLPHRYFRIVGNTTHLSIKAFLPTFLPPYDAASYTLMENAAFFLLKVGI